MRTWSRSTGICGVFFVKLGDFLNKMNDFVVKLGEFLIKLGNWSQPKATLSFKAYKIVCDQRGAQHRHRL